MSAQDDGGSGFDPFDDDEELPEPSPEVAAALEEAMGHFLRETPLGAKCPGCGSQDTKHVSIGTPDGESIKSGKWTVVLPPELFQSYCECGGCGLTWHSEEA